VRLAGRLAAAESIQLAFPQRPRVIDVSARGWTTSGVNEGRLVSGSLELARERDAERSGAALEAGAEFPAFVRVERIFNLDLDWTLDTIVTRIAPQRAALSVEIPLVKGESVLTDGVKVRNNEAALVGLGAGERRVQWHSGLARAETLEVSLPADAARSEVWSFIVNPQWNVVFEGFAPVLPANVNAASWEFRFMPRPGEKLTLKVTRPKGAKGTTLAIDSASLHTTIGSRSSTTTLQFAYRSTQGGRHVIKLPEQARVTGVTFDGRPQQLRPEKGELPLSLAPGAHSLLITWEESRDVSLLTHPSSVDLRSAASNLTFSVALPKLDAGELVLAAEVKAGQVKVTQLSANGPDLELSAEGYIRLRDQPAQSYLNLTTEFKFTDRYTNKDDITKALFGKSGAFDLDPKNRRAKRPDGFYAWRVSGALSRPAFAPNPGGAPKKK
jgi:type II secretion system protein N